MEGQLRIYTSGPDDIGCVDVGTIRLDSDWTLIPTGELEALRQQLENHKLMLAAIALQHDELEKVAQIEALTLSIKNEAYEAYWEASDNNRADRWESHFDDSVRKEFKKYWETNNLDAKYQIAPQQHLAEIRAQAVLEFAKQYKNTHEMIPATASPTVVNFANQYADSIRQERK